LAQVKEITLEDIWNGSFRTERMEVLHSMKNGQQYSVLNFNRSTRSTSIDLYDYKTQSKVAALVDSKDLETIPYFTNYTFSADESKIILATEVESIYRRSTLGVFFVYDIASKQLQKVSDSKIQEPTFSPDASQVAYGFNNNLYLKDLKSDRENQITFDGEKNKIINGITDWVYEEEFAFVRAYEWNADGQKIAFLRFDETAVPEFSMDVYGQALYQTQQVFKYPKAGEQNAVVSLHIYDLNKDLTKEVKLEKSYNDFYIPRIKWTSEASILSAQYINRHQNELDLWAIDTVSNTSSILLTETDAAYVDVTDNLTFLKDNSFIWTSEKDGHNHLYHYSKKANSSTN
jgi:dipeptidyl-peptidase-4